MQNLSIIDKKYINRIFDLKGSEIDRITKNVEKVDRMVALKEAEFLWMKKVHNMVKFTEHQIDLIDDVLTKDLMMLQECDLMDYSLLIIIINNSVEGKRDLEKIFEETSLIRRIFRSSDGKFIYCIGIIDYLQKYNFKKKFEHKLKKIIHDNKASAVDSKLYAFRLKKFVDNQVLGI